MEVGYTELIGDLEVVIFKRMLPIGIGCECEAPRKIRVWQVDNILDYHRFTM